MNPAIARGISERITVDIVPVLCPDIFKWDDTKPWYKPVVTYQTAEFNVSQAPLYPLVQADLNTYLSNVGIGHSRAKWPTIEQLVDLARFCESSVEIEPGFLEGYCSWVWSLERLGQFQNAVGIGQTVVDALLQLLPPDFDGLLPTNLTNNRPSGSFYPLVRHLHIAYIGLETEAGRQGARALEERVGQWLPARIWNP